MSIERAIERIEDYFKAYVPRKQMGENVLYILRDEAKSPCERCKHWGTPRDFKTGLRDGGEDYCMLGNYEGAVCVHDFKDRLKDKFEPKESKNGR